MKERRRLRPVRPLQPRDERPEHNPYRSSTRCCAPRFFSQTADRYTRGVAVIADDIRTDPPDGPFDLVMCRNLVFPYFEPGLQETVGAQLAHALRPAGALVLGAHDQLPRPAQRVCALGRPPRHLSPPAPPARDLGVPLREPAWLGSSNRVDRLLHCGTVRNPCSHRPPEACAAAAFATGLRCNVRANGFQGVWPHPRRLPAH